MSNTRQPRIAVRIGRSLLRIALALVAVLFLIWLGLRIYIAQPTLRSSAPSSVLADPARLEADVRRLAEDFVPRNFAHLGNTKRTADYIRGHFDRAVGTEGRAQDLWFDVGEDRYRNVSLLLGPENGKARVVIGAHYDAWLKFPGADDNASGVAGVLELARLLVPDESQLARPVELVCYPLEEPPFYGTDEMGSWFHADALRRDGIAVHLMISVEMIGFYSDEKGSQKFPVPGLELFYPTTGNFLALVGDRDNGGFLKKLKVSMKGTTELPVYSICAHRQLPGIDFSDHRNYWDLGFPAVMMTDTAFYRNTNYHTENDTADTLDYQRMAMAVTALRQAVLDLAGP